MPDVLIIDDEPGVLAALRIRLGAAGLAVACAACGEEGLAMARIAHPRAILLDVRMPDIDGFEVCRRLKADPETCEIPVIFLSAHVQAMTPERCIELGANASLTKPYDPAVVLATVEDTIAAAARERSEQP